jgi:hypothetical protein
MNRRWRSHQSKTQVSKAANAACPSEGRLASLAYTYVVAPSKKAWARR